MRYRVSDLPAVGVGAFMPIPAVTPAASSWGTVHVAGAPGTVAIDSPRPELPSLTTRGAPNTAQGSSVAPDAWMPAFYVASAANMGPSTPPDGGIGMANRRLNILPVPAADPARIPRIAQTPAPRLGGRAQVAQPRAFQRFPIWGRGGNG